VELVAELKALVAQAIVELQLAHDDHAAKVSRWAAALQCTDAEAYLYKFPSVRTKDKELYKRRKALNDLIEPKWRKADEARQIAAKQTRNSQRKSAAEQRADQRRRSRENYHQRLKTIRRGAASSGCLACPCVEHFGARYVAFIGQGVRVTSGVHVGTLGYVISTLTSFCDGWLTWKGKPIGGRRYCSTNMFCDNPCCTRDEWRGTSDSWKLPIGPNGMLEITTPEQHCRVQLASQSEPLLLSPYHLEPYPQTRDLAYDLGGFGVTPDTRMCWMGEPVDVRHFLAATFTSEADHSYGAYTGWYRCTRTIYARPEHVVCTDDAQPLRNLFHAFDPWYLPKVITLACTTCEEGCSQRGELHRGTKAVFTRLHELSQLCEPPAGGWTGRLRVGARAMLMSPHLWADPDSPTPTADDETCNMFIVKAICQCGECIELEHTLRLPHDELEPYRELSECPCHHLYKCSHLGHSGSCSFPEESDDESEPLAQPMSIEDGVLV